MAGLLAYFRPHRRDGLLFSNLWEVLADENGDLIESYAQPDGYHLRPAGYAAWTDYLCSHTEG